jgi:hypothetical protein
MGCTSLSLHLPIKKLSLPLPSPLSSRSTPPAPATPLPMQVLTLLWLNSKNSVAVAFFKFLLTCYWLFCCPHSPKLSYSPVHRHIERPPLSYPSCKKKIKKGRNPIPPPSLSHHHFSIDVLLAYGCLPPLDNQALHNNRLLPYPGCK